MSGREDFLAPAPGIQSDHPRVIALAKEITSRAADHNDMARRLFEYSRDQVAYSIFAPFERLEDYLALSTLKRGRGFCIQKAALLCTLARAAGIPARMGFADIKNHQLSGHLAEIAPDGVLYYHSFTEWLLDGRWLKATPSFDRALTEKQGWRLVEFIPGQDLVLPATDLEGRPHVTYLKYRGWRLGVPLQEAVDYIVEHTGPQGMDHWRALVAGLAEGEKP